MGAVPNGIAASTDVWLLSKCMWRLCRRDSSDGRLHRRFTGTSARLARPSRPQEWGSQAYADPAVADRGATPCSVQK
jgi:hypothetical protein